VLGPQGLPPADIERADRDGPEGLAEAIEDAAIVALRRFRVLQVVGIRLLKGLDCGRCECVWGEWMTVGLVMAAWLAYLKSALLLPKDPTIDPSPEELALRLQLRLERLNAMRESGARLMARDRIGRDVFLRGAPEGLRVVRTTAWDCSYFELIATYGQIQARSAPVMHVVKRRAVMTLDEALDHVSKMLGVALEWTSLEAFLPKDADPQLRRSALASSFLAMLELAKQGRLELQQETSFAPLMVKVSHGTISERAHQ
jgi:segregation and condensation protein A